MNNKVAPVVGWISLALLASVAIWQFALSVSSTLDTSQAVSRMGFGLIVSLLTILLITVLCRYSKSKPDLKFFSHSKKFLVGAGWYIVPAVVGLVIASLFGVVEISINTSFGDVVSAIALVAVLVFCRKLCQRKLYFEDTYLVN